MLKAPHRLINGSAFHGEDNILSCGFNYINYPLPVNNSVTAGASNRRSGYFSAFSITLFHADILCMEVHKSVLDSFKPLIYVRTAGKIAVACIKIYPDCRRLNKIINTVKAVRGFAVLLMRFEPYCNFMSFSYSGGFGKGLGHKYIVHLL